MVLPRVTGIRQKSSGVRVIITVRCPECGRIHRHDIGAIDDPEVSQILQNRTFDAWMACRVDLPGNFYRVILPKSQLREISKGEAAPAGEQTATPPTQPRRRKRRRRKPAAPATQS